MSQDSRSGNVAASLVAVAFTVLAGVLVKAALGATLAFGKAGYFILAFLSIGASAIAAIPSWRESFGRGLFRVKVKTFGLAIDVGGGSELDALSAGAEKPPPAVGGGVEAKANTLETQIASDISGILRTIGDSEDPLVLWRLAANAVRREEFGFARKVVDIGLEKTPRHAQLLVMSGYLHRRANDLPKAIEAAERAIVAADGIAQQREYFFVAHANLAFYLASRADPKDKERALKCGKAASDHAEAFPNRHSFLINYGYAQFRFADSSKELLDSIKYLTMLAERTDLDQNERTEVAGYIVDVGAKLQRAV